MEALIQVHHLHIYMFYSEVLLITKLMTDLMMSQSCT